MLIPGFVNRLVQVCLLPLTLACLVLPGCGQEEEWQVAAQTPSAAMMAVHGTSADDVWVVGAEDEAGALALHFDGTRWERRDVGFFGDLWWVHAVATDQVFFAGSDATILRFDGESFERLTTPGLGRDTVFGIWGERANDLYAVGARAGRNGFLWHYDGQEWTELALPRDMPTTEGGDLPPLFKVTGRGDTVWVVGDRGVVLEGNAARGFEVLATEGEARLFTVIADGSGALAVGGGQEGAVFDIDGGSARRGRDADLPLIQGAATAGGGQAWLSGRDGAIYERRAGYYFEVDPGLKVDVESLHAIWQDPSGGVWTVGGEVLSGSLGQGVALYRGPRIDAYQEKERTGEPPAPACPEDAVDPAPGKSMARRWNEQLLNAVRRDLPRPTVHARNLYHVSLASWDVWASFAPNAEGVLVKDKQSLPAEATLAAREEALAYANYRILSQRYAAAVGGAVSQACFDAFFERLGLDASNTSTSGDSPGALGNRVAEAVLTHFADDGSNQEGDYEDPNGWTPPTPPLIVDEPGTSTDQPLVWQQLVLAEAVTQNGISEGAGVRNPVGTHWGQVTPFALERTAPDRPYFDAESPPDEYDEDLRAAIVQVIAKSAELDTADGVTMDISPGAYGNNSLGKDDGVGHLENPVTGKPYEPQVVLRGDFVRILAEFWADGPHSETPPGHWNTLANQAADDPANPRKLFGEGPSLAPLDWDVHVYLALNGALHDAAIAAWELKQHHSSARPITLIRYYGGLGQSSDPALPSYHEDGLPLVDGLIELITEESSAPGERHQHLARYVGDLALFSWRGEPGDREREDGGVGWIRAVEWIPYQRRTFVTPAFPGYVSGHSTFSRAAAEVLTTISGSPYFPGGLGTDDFDPGYLVFEYGPIEPVQLQWATYYDAADQAGQSRLWGGIHIVHDDHDGRVIGSEVGLAAVAKARQYFAP